HRPADRGAAAEPRDSDRPVERIAPANLVKMRPIFLGAARRQSWHAKRQVAHRHADAENPRRCFSRGAPRKYLGIIHGYSGRCGNLKLRFEGLQAIAAISDANFGIKQAPGNTDFW